ncbi:MAG: NDP-sugar synthase, partial [Planctomycetota bacterium]
PVPGDVNAGTYLLDPAVLRGWPGGRPLSIEREVFPALIAEGRRVYGFPGDAYWLDLGTPEKYLQAHFDLLERKVRGVRYPAPYVSPEARVDLRAHLGIRLGQQVHQESGRIGAGRSGLADQLLAPFGGGAFELEFEGVGCAPAGFRPGGAVHGHRLGASFRNAGLRVTGRPGYDPRRFSKAAELHELDPLDLVAADDHLSARHPKDDLGRVLTHEMSVQEIAVPKVYPVEPDVLAGTLLRNPERGAENQRPHKQASYLPPSRCHCTLRTLRTMSD